MRVRIFGWVTLIAGLLALGQVASAQHPGLEPPYGIASAGMGPGGFAPPPGAYGPPGFSPAAYGGVMGPGPMPPQGPPMGDPGYCPDCYGGAGYGASCTGWTNRYFAFGEYLYLRPRNAEVSYAVPVDNTLLPALVQLGPVARIDPDYSNGFRVGFGTILSEWSSLSVTYAQLDNDQFDNVSLSGLDDAVLQSLVSNPNRARMAGDEFLDAAATLQTRFKLLDVDYKGLFAYDTSYQVAWVFGARYGKLEQNLAVGFAAATFEEVLARDTFEGGGIKLGLEGQRYGTNNNFFLYGKGSTSWLAGTTRTSYILNDRDGLLVDNITNTAWTNARVVTMLDLEAGVGWKNFNDNLRLSFGYMFSTWFNTVRVNEWINAVQQNNFVDPSDNFNGRLSFDGLTARVELLW
jgi:hypothetical protein